ncbi:MAG: hypothetical protein IT210_13610 [Armatimonadetes bacterium]|nr:hypothetical protein [Armatimonadota bacterium]
MPDIIVAGGFLAWLPTRLPARIWGRPRRHVYMDSLIFSPGQFTPFFLGATDASRDTLIYGTRPDMKEVERALRQVACRQPEAGEEWAEAFHLLEAKKEADPAVLIEDLERKDWKMRFAARHALLSWGGEAARPLLEIARSKRRMLAARAGSDVQVPVAANRPPSTRRASVWILDNIARDTVWRLGWRTSRLICPYCLTHFTAVSLAWAGQTAMNYIGCRSCGQSREYIERTLIAILDREMAERHIQEGRTLRINWFLKESLFDFDTMEIVRASDEDVERFAVQVGNDTGPYRQPRYARMTCRIRAQCRLSENTLKILESLFRKVEKNIARIEEKGERGSLLKDEI